MSKELSTKVLAELKELVSNMEFVNKNVEAFDERNKDTKLADDFEMELYKLMAEVQKARKVVDGQVNTVFLYTPRDKLQL